MGRFGFDYGEGVHLTMCFRAAAGALVSPPPAGSRATAQAKGLWLE